MSSIAEPVTDRLRRDILDGVFPPGERLVELNLTDKYAVGRAAIRSAIVELGKEGLVTREANRGAAVRKISVEEAIEINEARAALEGFLARRAADKATAGERASLRSIAEKMRDAVSTDDPVSYSNLTREFHEQVRAFSRHAIASQLVETLCNQSAHHQFRLAMMPGRPSQSLPEHEAVIEAIVDGREDDSEQEMRRYMLSAIDALRRWDSHKVA